ncbi:hypothetical protein U1Q18_045532 [Sarracenia purpurea var. burkii]
MSDVWIHMILYPVSPLLSHEHIRPQGMLISLDNKYKGMRNFAYPMGINDDIALPLSMETVKARGPPLCATTYLRTLRVRTTIVVCHRLLTYVETEDH